MQHEIKLKAKNRLKTCSLKKTMAFYNLINQISIYMYLTRMVIMTNISHAEKTIKFSSDKKDTNLRTVHRMRNTKLLIHIEM